MTRQRLALITLALLAVWAAVLAWPRADEVAHTAPTAVAALPLNLPPPPAAPSGPVRQAAPATTAATAPGPSPRPRIGSEGYGPHIDDAQAGNDAAAAWEAVGWLRQCATNEARRSSFETVRNQGVSQEMLTQLMVEADAEARRCQTVTAQHQALLPGLAARAMRAGMPEAASAYAGAVFPGDLTAAQRLEVTEAMRHDARSGDAPSLLGAVLANEAWGLSDAERLAFIAAYGELPDQQEHHRAVLKTLVDSGQIRLRQMPTPEQQAAARLAGQQIVDQARARSSKP